MFLKTILTWLLPIFLWLCVARCQTSAQISGKIDLAEGWRPRLYLIQARSFAEIATSFVPFVLDSAWVESDGSFEFEHLPKADAPLLLELCIQPVGARFKTRLLDDNPLLANYMPFVFQPGETIRMMAAADRLQASFSIVNPSPENRALLQLRDLRHVAYTQSWAKHAGEQPDEHNLMERETAWHNFQRPLMAFADSTPYLWPALLAAHWVSPSGDYERVPEFLVGLCRKWRSQTSGQPWVDQLCQSANPDKLPLLAGSIMPDYLLPMSTGDSIRLHDLLGSRLTILDIWASWCAPCRRENREVLTPMFQLYRDRGLQIVGYSIDSNLEAWKAAMGKDQANWPQASHLSGDETPFMQALRITTIPANFVLDAQGKVLAKNVHGAELKALIAQYLP